MLWAVAYVLVSQVGYIVVTNVASDNVAGGITLYAFASLLFQLPYGIIGVSILTAIMPRMSRHAAAGQMDDVKDDASLANRLSIVALTPVAAGIIVLAGALAIVAALYGAVTLDDTIVLGATLAALALGLVPFAVTLVQMRVFYAMKDARTPTLINAIMVAVRIPLLIAVRDAGRPSLIIPGLAVATSISYLVGAIAGEIWLRARYGPMGTRRTLVTLVKMTVAGAAGAGAALLAGNRLLTFEVDDAARGGGADPVQRHGRPAGDRRGRHRCSRSRNSSRCGTGSSAGAIGSGGHLRRARPTPVRPPTSRTLDVAPSRVTHTRLADVARARLRQRQRNSARDERAERTVESTLPMSISTVTAEQQGAGGQIRCPTTAVAQRSDGAGSGPPGPTASPAIDPARHVIPTASDARCRTAVDNDRPMTDPAGRDASAAKAAALHDRLRRPPTVTTRRSQTLPTTSPSGGRRRSPGSTRAAPALTPGTTVGGRYRLVSLVSADHSGHWFWRAKDTVLPRDMAVTMLPDTSGASATVARTLRAGRLHHIGLPQTLDVGTDYGQSYVVGQWVDGATLTDLLSGGPLEPDVATSITAKLSEAVAEAHRNGIAFGAINPSLVRVNFDGQVRLSHVIAHGSATPDQDIRAIGALLYLMLTGTWPLGDPIKPGVAGQSADRHGRPERELPAAPTRLGRELPADEVRPRCRRRCPRWPNARCTRRNRTASTRSAPSPPCCAAPRRSPASPRHRRSPEVKPLSPADRRLIKERRVKLGLASVVLAVFAVLIVIALGGLTNQFVASIQNSAPDELPMIDSGARLDRAGSRRPRPTPAPTAERVHRRRPAPPRTSPVQDRRRPGVRPAGRRHPRLQGLRRPGLRRQPRLGLADLGLQAAVPVAEDRRRADAGTGAGDHPHLGDREQRHQRHGRRDPVGRVADDPVRPDQGARHRHDHQRDGRRSR